MAKPDVVLVPEIASDAGRIRLSKARPQPHALGARITMTVFMASMIFGAFSQGISRASIGAWAIIASACKFAFRYFERCTVLEIDRDTSTIRLRHEGVMLWGTLEERHACVEIERLECTLEPERPGRLIGIELAFFTQSGRRIPLPVMHVERVERRDEAVDLVHRLGHAIGLGPHRALENSPRRLRFRVARAASEGDLPPLRPASEPLRPADESAYGEAAPIAFVEPVEAVPALEASQLPEGLRVHAWEHDHVDISWPLRRTWLVYVLLYAVGACFMLWAIWQSFGAPDGLAAYIIAVCGLMAFVPPPFLYMLMLRAPEYARLTYTSGYGGRVLLRSLLRRRAFALDEVDGVAMKVGTRRVGDAQVRYFGTLHLVHDAESTPLYTTPRDFLTVDELHDHTISLVVALARALDVPYSWENPSVETPTPLGAV